MSTVIIPAYKPDETLVTITDQLWAYGCRIIVVDDGSGEEYKEMPLRSRWGNKITRTVFRFAGGVKVSDTQIPISEALRIRQESIRTY